MDLTGNDERAAYESRATYDPRAIEVRRQREWAAREAFRTPPMKADASGIYIKASAPFTSGNVHIGHVRSYHSTISFPLSGPVAISL